MYKDLLSTVHSWVLQSIVYSLQYLVSSLQSIGYSWQSMVIVYTLQCINCSPKSTAMVDSLQTTSLQSMAYILWSIVYSFQSIVYSVQSGVCGPWSLVHSLQQILLPVACSIQSTVCSLQSMVMVCSTQLSCSLHCYIPCSLQSILDCRTQTLTIKSRDYRLLTINCDHRLQTADYEIRL